MCCMVAILAAPLKKNILEDVHQVKCPSRKQIVSNIVGYDFILLQRGTYDKEYGKPTVSDRLVFSDYTLLHKISDKDGASTVVTLLEKLSMTPGITFVWPNMKKLRKNTKNRHARL